MRAHEFITEGKTTGLRKGGRGIPDNNFSSAHPGLVAPDGRGDLYIGRYYDFYRVASLTGMDPDELDNVDNISFFGNLPLFSAYTQADHDKLTRVMKKLKMKPKDYITTGSTEKEDTHVVSPVKPFKGYKK